MISNEEGWHYLAVEVLSALLIGIISKHQGDFYCLKCLHCFRTKDKHQSPRNICKNLKIWNILMPFEDTKISEFNQCQKSDKTPFIFYADLERLIEKIDGCKTILKSHLQQH